MKSQVYLLSLVVGCICVKDGLQCRNFPSLRIHLPQSCHIAQHGITHRSTYGVQIRGRYRDVGVRPGQLFLYVTGIICASESWRIVVLIKDQNDKVYICSLSGSVIILRNDCEVIAPLPFIVNTISTPWGGAVCYSHYPCCSINIESARQKQIIFSNLLFSEW